MCIRDRTYNEAIKMNYKFIKYSISGHTAILMISRASALNAINRETLIEIDNALTEAETDEQVYTLIITGEGRAFAAGADILEMKDLNPEEALLFCELGSRLFRRIELLKKPVIAAVNGYALGGGCELALSCDIRIAADDARFGQPEVQLGIIPGFSGTVRLSRITGLAKAKEMIFTGEQIDAQEAFRTGLINRIVPVGTLMDEAKKLAKKIEKNAQLAIRHAKSSINRGIETDIETAIVNENTFFGLCFSSSDQKEGMNAFIEKRSPDFKQS